MKPKQNYQWKKQIDKRKHVQMRKLFQLWTNSTRRWQD